MVSVLPSVIESNGASHVTIRNFVIEACRATALTIFEGEGLRVSGSVMRNVGGDALRIQGGLRHRVEDSLIYNTGRGGIRMSGGERTTLQPAGHVARGNHIHHYSRWNRMYNPAISMDGVGLEAVKNYIHDAPHMAIQFSGNRPRHRVQ